MTGRTIVAADKSPDDVLSVIREDSVNWSSELFAQPAASGMTSRISDHRISVWRKWRPVSPLFPRALRIQVSEVGGGAELEITRGRNLTWRATIAALFLSVLTLFGGSLMVFAAVVILAAMLIQELLLQLATRHDWQLIEEFVDARFSGQNETND